MRNGRPAWPSAICTAAPMPCVGTRPSARAASWSRQPATNTAPRRPSAGAHALQSAYGSSGWCGAPVAVRGDRLRVCRPRPARLPASGRARAPSRRGSRGRSRGTAAGSDARTGARTDGRGSPSLRRRPETRRARAAAQDRGRGTPRAAGSAARAAGTASCRGCRDTRRRAARRASARAPPSRAAAPRRARPTAGPRTRRRSRATPESSSAPACARPGQRAEEMAHRRADEPLERLVLVRIAAQHPRQARQRVHERRADDGDAGGEARVRSRPRAASPATRRSRAASTRRPSGSSSDPPRRRAGSARRGGRSPPR